MKLDLERLPTLAVGTCFLVGVSHTEHAGMLSNFNSSLSLTTTVFVAVMVVKGKTTFTLSNPVIHGWK